METESKESVLLVCFDDDDDDILCICVYILF